MKANDVALAHAAAADTARSYDLADGASLVAFGDASQLMLHDFNVHFNLACVQALAVARAQNGDERISASNFRNAFLTELRRLARERFNARPENIAAENRAYFFSNVNRLQCSSQDVLKRFRADFDVNESRALSNVERVTEAALMLSELQYIDEKDETLNLDVLRARLTSELVDKSRYASHSSSSLVSNMREELSRVVLAKIIDCFAR